MQTNDENCDLSESHIQKRFVSVVNLPAVTVSSIDIDAKLYQKLNDLCMSGTDSIV